MDKRSQTDEVYLLMASRFKVLAEPIRLKIIHELHNGEFSVGELVDRVGGLQANVSKHLGIMLEAGLVSRRKEGLSAFYRVADTSVFELCAIVCNSLEKRFKDQREAIKFFK